MRDLVEGDGDEVLEMYAPVIRLTPSGNTAEDIARTSTDFHRVRHALEQQGVNVIESPNKLTADGGVKHSDDQRLMIRLALTCTRLKPDFLVLVAADGDYAPLVWGLREEGIRTKLISDEDSLAPELKSAVYSCSNVHAVVKEASEKFSEKKR